MKRCPECDFLYENDQRFCDMDGRELSLAPRPLLLTEGLVPKPPAMLVKSQRRRLAVRVTAAIILGAVLFLAFYGSMHRIPAEEISYSATKANASTIAAGNAAPERKPAAVTEQVSAASVETADQLVRDVRKAQGVSSPAKARTIAAPSRVPAAPRQEMKSDSKQENHKKESKLGSFFKKTGRLLKKPFGK